MKKAKHFFLFFLITFLSTAQETRTIKVIGKAIHLDNEISFEGTVSLNSIYSSYRTKGMTLSQIKFKYNEVLKKNGLSITDLEEDLIGYLYLGYNQGVLYHFKTSSLDKFNSFLASKSVGCQSLNYGYSFMISEKEASIAASKAIKNAKDKAQIIAKALNKELGNIIYIEDNNIFNKKLRNQSLYYDLDVGHYIYYVVVIFELKDK